MSKTFAILALAALTAGPILSFDAEAQPRRGRQGRPVAPAVSIEPPAVPNQSCPEGRTADGRCVNAAVALAGTNRGFIYSQPRLSMLSPPWVLPSATGTNDRIFRSPNNPITDADVELNQLLRR